VTFFFFAPTLDSVFILWSARSSTPYGPSYVDGLGTGFHTPDKNHIHHRLIAGLGHGHRRTVIIPVVRDRVALWFLSCCRLFDTKANVFIAPRGPRCW